LSSFSGGTGLTVNPEALLFFWPSRLDPFQKGVELLEEVIWRFSQDNPDVQIAIVADGIGHDRTHTDRLGGMACASGGRISYHSFDEELSLLGYAGACDVFGASLYEPCGQIDQVGNLFGATATNRNTGGYHDKIRELRLKSEGAPQDVGNGFLFRDYDAGGLRYALNKSLAFHRLPLEVRERQVRRIMRQARERYSLDHMIAEYIRIYERLNNGRPIA
jgi:glycogen synthase